MKHRYSDVIDVFNSLFSKLESTILVCGGDEPYYKPGEGPDRPAQVVFARGYFASALHEVAHWCIAGRQRRLLPDYGYWYVPDGRSAEQQLEFVKVEVKPQAMEWVFSAAAGSQFHFSADNLPSGGCVTDQSWLDFQFKVAQQAQNFVVHGLPQRAELFAVALAQYYRTDNSWRDPGLYKVNRSFEPPTIALSTANLHGDSRAAKRALEGLI